MLGITYKDGVLIAADTLGTLQCFLFAIHRVAAACWER